MIHKVHAILWNRLRDSVSTSRDRIPKPGVSFALFALVLNSVVMVGAAAQNAKSAAGKDPCHTTWRYDSLRISQDSIGPLDLRLALSSLKDGCPESYDTVFQASTPGGRERKYVGVVFKLGSLTAVALQYSRTEVEVDARADGWVVSGEGALLPLGVPLTAEWSALRRFGRAQASAGGVVVVRFCAWPRMLFTLNASPNAVVSESGAVDLERIPADATIHHVFIMSEKLVASLTSCT